MRKFLKLLHTLGGIGLTGALFVQMLMLQNMPPVDSLQAYAAKLALGIVVFEGTLIAVQGPAKREAALAAAALLGEVDPAQLGLTASAEWKSTLVVLGVAIANVVLGVYRPKFSRKPAAA